MAQKQHIKWGEWDASTVQEYGKEGLNVEKHKLNYKKVFACLLLEFSTDLKKSLGLKSKDAY